MRDTPSSRVLLAPVCRSSSSARVSKSAAEAPLPPVFAFVHVYGSSDGAFLAHRTHSRPALCLREVDLLLSSMVPTNLRCPLPVRYATNLVADVEVGSRCLLIFLRRSINTKSYSSTSHDQIKVHKQPPRCSIFATESSYASHCSSKCARQPVPGRD